MLLETLFIPSEQIVANEGQIEGLPPNPRSIKNGRFRKLMQSIKDNPEMLSLREVIVFPFNKQFVAIGGNQRQAACKELGHKTIPCKVLSPQTSIEQLKAISILDNTNAGEWDMDILSANFDEADLKDWMVDIPKEWGNDSFEEQPKVDHEPPKVSLTIEFETLDVYQDVLQRVSEVIEEYEGVSIK